MQQSGDKGQRSLRLTLELLIIASGVMAMAQAATGIVVPVLPQFIETLGGDPVFFGLAIAAYSLARVVANIPSGVLAERWGRKPVLLVGAVVTAAGAVLSGTAPNLEVLLLFRFLTGLGAGMAITASQIAVTDLSTVENRGRSLSVGQGWQFISGIASPGIGGLAAELVDIRAPFYISGIGVLLLGGLAWLRLPETRHMAMTAARAHGAREAGSFTDNLRMLAGNRNFVLACCIGFATFFTRFGTMQGLVPLFAHEELGWTPGQMGALFSVAALINGVLLAPAGFLSDRFGRKKLIVPAELLGAVGLFLVPLSMGPLVFTVVFYALNVCQALGSSGSPAYLGDVAPPNQRGLSLGVYRTVGDAAGTIAPLVTSSLATIAFTAAFWLNSALVLGFTLVFAFLAAETAGRRVREQRAAQQQRGG